MKGVYRVFAYLIAAEVIIQASAIALAVFGLGKWIEDGGTLTKSVMENDDTSINGVIGFAIHGINGTMIIPILGLLFLIISFFAKIEGGVKWALFVFLDVVLQWTLAFLAFLVAWQFGALHPVNAFVLAALGFRAYTNAKTPAVSTTTPTGATA